MKLDSLKEMEIMSVKKLCLHLEEKKEPKAIAIICSRYEPDKSSLEMLDACLILDIDDTLMEERAHAFKVCDGERVREFLEQNNSFEKLFVCCDSGESRSTALGAAILRYFGKSDMAIWKNPWFHPNMLVYKKQLVAFGIKKQAVPAPMSRA